MQRQHNFVDKVLTLQNNFIDVVDQKVRNIYLDEGKFECDTVEMIIQIWAESEVEKPC